MVLLQGIAIVLFRYAIRYNIRYAIGLISGIAIVLMAGIAKVLISGTACSSVLLSLLCGKLIMYL